MKDQDLLAELDARAARAAADLRRRADGRPRPESDGAQPLALSAPGRAGRALGRSRRSALAVAAAFALLVGAAGWWVIGSGDDDADTAGLTTGQPRPFVAGVLPDGFVPGGMFGPGTGTPTVGPLAVYGPSPEAPRVGVMAITAFTPDPGTERVDVGGRTAYRYNELLGLPALVVADGPSGILVIGPDLSDGALTELAAAAERDGARARIAPAALAADERLLGEVADGYGLVGSVGPLRSGSVPLRTGIWVEPSDDADLARAATVTSGAGDEVDVHAARLFGSTAKTITVRGREAVLVAYPDRSGGTTTEQVVVGEVGGGSPDGSPTPEPVLPESASPVVLSLSWLEATGELVRVQSVGLTEAELLGMAEGLEPVSETEWADLVQRTQLGEFTDRVTGRDTVEIGAGSFADGTRWELRASVDEMTGPDGQAEEPLATTSLHVALPMGGEGSQGSSSSGAAPFLSTDTLDQAGRHFASGLLADTAATVELRRADGSRLAEAVVVEGGGHRAWVAELTEDPTVVVALDGAGVELGRVTFDELDGNVSVSSEGQGREITTTSVVTPGD